MVKKTINNTPELLVIVDKEWKLDPGNELWEENEYGTGNSVLWIT
jgi:hypothetical protein